MIRLARASCVLVALFCCCKRFTPNDLSRFGAANADERDALMLGAAESGCLISKSYADICHAIGPPDEWDDRLMFDVDIRSGNSLVVRFSQDNICVQVDLSRDSIKADESDVEFNEKTWNNHSAERSSMARDLVLRKKLIGLTRDEVLLRLGSPATAFGPMAIYYGRHNNGERRVYGKKLRLLFGGSGMVQSAVFEGS